MKIYVCHSNSFDYKNKLYIPLKDSELWTQYQWFLPHMISYLPDHSKDIIANADLIVAEVSLPSTGMGIELGWAEFLNRPIVFMHQKETRISSSLQLISPHFISYIESDDMIFKLASFLQNDFPKN